MYLSVSHTDLVYLYLVWECYSPVVRGHRKRFRPEIRHQGCNLECWSVVKLRTNCLTLLGMTGLLVKNRDRLEL